MRGRTVLLGGRRVLACLTLTAAARGARITTVEGLAGEDGPLHPMQQAFLDHDAYQCGYWTPGQILAAIACVHEGHPRTDDEIREHMSGSLCRPTRPSRRSTPAGRTECPPPPPADTRRSGSRDA